MRPAPNQFLVTMHHSKHDDFYPDARVHQIKQKVASIDEVDVAVICVSPTHRPRLHDFEVVAAVGKTRSAFDHLDVADGEVMLPSEVRTEMVVGNPAMLLVFCRIVFVLVLDLIVVLVLIVLYLIVFLFLSCLVILVLVPIVIVLGHDRQHRSEQKCCANRTRDRKSFHSDSRIGFVSHISDSIQMQSSLLVLPETCLGGVKACRVRGMVSEGEALFQSIYGFVATIFPDSSCSTYAHGILGSCVKTVSHFSGIERA